MRLTVFVWLLSLPALFAQVSNTGSALPPKVGMASLDIVELEGEMLNTKEGEWTFFLNPESQTLFIDFAKLESPPSKLTVLDRQGEAKITDMLFEVPGDAIYQVDLQHLAAGNYKIELATYQKIHKQEISLQ